MYIFLILDIHDLSKYFLIAEQTLHLPHQSKQKYGLDFPRGGNELDHKSGQSFIKFFKLLVVVK